MPARRFPTDLARAHIEALATKHRITLSWLTRGWLKAHAYPPLRTAIVPRVTSGLRYLVALHELGHVADRGARYWQDHEAGYGLSVCEGYAWAWAAEHRSPDIPVTQADWAEAAALLAGYWAYGGRAAGNREAEAEPLATEQPVPHEAACTEAVSSSRRPPALAPPR
jgi:hypothetical protein